MTGTTGAAAALPMGGQVLGSQSRISKPASRGQGGGKKKQTGPYMGMTSRQKRHLKVKKHIDQAIEEGRAGLGAAENAEGSAGNGDGGDDTALHQNPQEGHDVNPTEGGQASSNLGSVNSPMENQAPSGDLGELPDFDLFPDEGPMGPEPVPQQEQEQYRGQGNEPYIPPHKRPQK